MSNSNLHLHIISRADAKAIGIKKYYTGKPCKYGHIDQRKVCDFKCMTCNRIQYGEWLDKNRESKNQKDAEWRSNNESKQRALSKAWKSRNEEKNNEITARWRKENHHHVLAYNAGKRCRTRAATPSWANKAEIVSIYKQASSIPLEVDHIVPLTSDFVCGLHCEDNMQMLTRQENASKRNFHWPDMPDVKDPELLLMVKEFKGGL